MLMCEKCSALLKCGYNNGKGKPGARIRKIKQAIKDRAHKVLDVEQILSRIELTSNDYEALSNFITT